MSVASRKSERAKTWRQNNPDKVRVWAIAYRQRPEVKEKAKIRCRLYQQQWRREKPDGKRLDNWRYAKRKGRSWERYRSWGELEYSWAWYRELNLDQKALAAIDACWGKRKPFSRMSVEERRAYGSEAARRRHQRLRNTPEWKVKQCARNTVARIARSVGKRRSPRTRTHEYLGCDYDFARQYLEQRFRPGMTWENHGTVWHIDHVVPLASFDLTNRRGWKRAMHYTNLQPLFVKENRAKAAKVELQEMLPI